MSIKDLKCECCLGQLKEITPKHYKCESCDKEYVDHVASEEEVIWLINANQTLRKGNFDDAYEEFSNIVSKYPECYEAYFGMSLCTHGIMYVDDVLENKKVPVCYNISTESILDDVNYQKALKYSPEELKENYLEQARKIEVIRKEWLEKASKESPYDIFISFKQSDREKGLEKTKDFYSAQELYNHLTYKCGLKVFFSPETLKNKISEQYEPYIYAALNTSKVMIVYGENPEYFQATWVKNEWIRFLRKIKNKEKEPNSLVVCYKGFDAYSLPKELKSMQALKADSFDFLDTLLNHINKVFESDQGKQKLERKEIKVGQIATRSRTIGGNQIVKRELGTSTVVRKDATTEKILDSVELFISRARFDMAKTQLEKVLESSPNDSKANFLYLLCKNAVKNENELIELLIKGDNTFDMKDIEKLISISNKKEAEHYIDVIKTALIKKIKNHYIPSLGFIPTKFEDDILSMYNVLSGYEYEGSKELNKLVLDASSKNDAYLKLFNVALRTLEEDQVDEYIDYHIAFVKNIEFDNKIDRKYVKEQTGEDLSTIKEIITYMLERALKVDEGNSFILEELYSLSYDIKYLESSLAYAKDKAESKKLLIRYVKRHSLNLNAPYDEILKYIPKEETKLYNTALQKRYDVLKKAIETSKSNKERHLSQAKYYLEQVINEIGATEDNLYQLFKYNLGCVSDIDLINHPIKLDTLEGFTDSFNSLDKNTQIKLLDILDAQERKLTEDKRKKEEQEKKEKEKEQRKKEEEKKEQERIKEERKLNRKEKSKKWMSKIYATIFVLLSLFISYTSLDLLGVVNDLFDWDKSALAYFLSDTRDFMPYILSIVSIILSILAIKNSYAYILVKQSKVDALRIVSAVLAGVSVLAIILAASSFIFCFEYLFVIF